MAFKLKSGNTTNFKQMGATEAIKQVNVSTSKYPNQRKSKMHTEREIYKAKLRGDYQDLTGDKLKKASYDDHPEELIKGHSIPESPAKQKAEHMSLPQFEYDLSDMTVVDKRSQEVIDKEKEEIKKEEEAKRKDQERIDQQIKGTYVETEEDVKKRKEEFRESGPRKKSPAKQNASVSDSANRGNVNTENIKILPKDNKSQKQKDFEDLATSQKNNQNAPKATVVDTTKRNINRMIQGNALASLFTGRTTKS